MKFLSLRRALVAGLSLLVLMASGSAHAIFRAYLSVSGSDTNPCTVSAPCRLLPAALAAVDAGGEIWMLDSANFNTATVNITKSVTIIAIPGQLGSVTGNGGPAISIATAGVNVTLQNLNILSSTTISGDIGVGIGNGTSVSIINCNIFGFKGLNGGALNNGLGIWVTSANATKVNVVGSIIRNNAHGIVVGGNGRATISKTHVLNNSGVGIWASSSGTGLVMVDVSDSVSSGNSIGFAATGDSTSAFSYMNVIRSVATENTSHGFVANGGTLGIMTVTDSMSTSNGGSGFASEAGATFGSRGNNTVIFNFGPATSGTISPVTGL